MTTSNDRSGDGMNLNLPSADVLQAIGESIVLFNNIESVLDDWITQCLGGDLKASRIVTAGLGFRQKVDLLYRLSATLTRSDATVRIREWLTAVEKVSTTRNTIVHAQWLGTDSPLTTLRIDNPKARSYPAYMHAEPMPLSQLHEIVDHVRNVYNVGCDLVWQFLPEGLRP